MSENLLQTGCLQKLFFKLAITMGFQNTATAGLIKTRLLLYLITLLTNYYCSWKISTI
jgi:hypothetical protein